MCECVGLCARSVCVCNSVTVCMCTVCECDCVTDGVTVCVTLSVNE